MELLIGIPRWAQRGQSAANRCINNIPYRYVQLVRGPVIRVGLLQQVGTKTL